MPVYIHPYNPPDVPYMYHDHPELFGPVWSWTEETATHALRLVFAGVFDRYPRAKLILGHMGETLPYQLWRLDSRRAICNANGRTLQRPPSDYLKHNIWVTTSGVCSDAPLQCALSALGEDRVLFPVDHPFESTAVANEWIESADVSDDVRRKLCADNARALLGLPGARP